MALITFKSSAKYNTSIPTMAQVYGSTGFNMSQMMPLESYIYGLRIGYNYRYPAAAGVPAMRLVAQINNPARNDPNYTSLGSFNEKEWFYFGEPVQVLAGTDQLLFLAYFAEAAPPAFTLEFSIEAIYSDQYQYLPNLQLQALVQSIQANQ